MSTSDEVRRHLPLHPFELRILLVLVAEGPVHGYRIVKAIEERDGTWKKVFPANLYRRIRDLLSRGLIEEAAVPPGADDDSRRRYFRSTELGDAVARAEARRLAGLVDDLRAADLLEPA
jgi:DNA-binding PadR family transcriptional regulator